MTKHDLAALRLKNQRISTSNFERPEEVTTWMGALQAQDYTQAVWAIGLRTRSGTLADLEHSLAEGRLIRTWTMRGTLHFVTPKDARWMLALSGARQIAAARTRRRQLGLDEEIFTRSERVFNDALRGGKRLPRPQIMHLLEHAGISIAGQRGIHILGQLAQMGQLYVGPKEARQQTFGLLDELVPEVVILPREEALSVLAQRYFSSHGPASERDFAWWGGLTLTDARAGLAAVKDLVSLEVEGITYWAAASALDEKIPQASEAYLIPGYDEYYIGYTDRSAIVAPGENQQFMPGGNGMIFPMIVVDGQIIGTWKRTLISEKLTITLKPFTRPKGDLISLIAEAAKRYSCFLGVPLDNVSIESK